MAAKTEINHKFSKLKQCKFTSLQFLWSEMQPGLSASVQVSVELAPPGGSREESRPCLFQLLETPTWPIVTFSTFRASLPGSVICMALLLFPGLPLLLQKLPSEDIGPIQTTQHHLPIQGQLTNNLKSIWNLNYICQAPNYHKSQRSWYWYHWGAGSIILITPMEICRIRMVLGNFESGNRTLNNLPGRNAF